MTVIDRRRPWTPVNRAGSVAASWWRGSRRTTARAPGGSGRRAGARLSRAAPEAGAARARRRPSRARGVRSGAGRRRRGVRSAAGRACAGPGGRAPRRRRGRPRRAGVEFAAVEHVRQRLALPRRRSAAAGSRSIASPSTRKRKKHFSAATVRAWLAGAGRWAASAARKRRSSAGRTSAPRADSLAGEKGETGADVARVGRAGERREAALDRGVVEEVVGRGTKGPPFGAPGGPVGEDNKSIRLTGQLRKGPRRRGPSSSPTVAAAGSSGARWPCSGRSRRRTGAAARAPLPAASRAR